MRYAPRHDPFVYFHSITDDVRYCDAHVINFRALAPAMWQAGTTPNLSFITPDVCDDGHDSPCKDGRPGGLRTANKFLRTWVPRITGSPAYRRDGLLVILFDEASRSDSSACCASIFSAPPPSLICSRRSRRSSASGRSRLLVGASVAKTRSRTCYFLLCQVAARRVKNPIQNMNDRLAGIGGTLTVSASPGTGTTVAGTIPVGHQG